VSKPCVGLLATSPLAPRSRHTRRSSPAATLSPPSPPPPSPPPPAKPSFDVSDGPPIIKERMQRRRDRSMLLSAGAAPDSGPHASPPNDP
jgi:hypothetical protein